MKPPFTYYGGKQTIKSWIYAQFKDHKIYVEPFAGGATLLFHKPFNKRHIEVLNDRNSEIINFYNVLSDTAKQKDLIHKLKYTPYSETLYHHAKDIYRNPSCYNDVQRAWALYINCNMSFASGIGKGFGYTKTFSEHGTTSPNRFMVKYKNLESCAKRLKYVTLHNRDALEIIKLYDTPNTLFYIDPPYVDTQQGHYSGYTEEHFQTLMDLVAKIQGKFLVSTYDNDVVKKLDFRTIKKDTVNCSAKIKTEKNETRPVRQELLLMNY